MNNIAYKVAKNISNLPDGFITEHFETDADAEEGYLVTSKDNFSKLMENNAVLFKAWQEVNGKPGDSVVSDDPSIVPDPQPLPAPISKQVEGLSAASKAEQDAIKSKKETDEALFQQFIAWKNSNQ